MQKPAYPNLPTRAIQLSTRTIAVFRNTALGIAAIGLGWAVVFSAMGWWPIVALDLAIIASGLGTYILIRREHLSFGLLVPQASLMLIAVIMGLILDVPTAETPRVSHIYLLFLAAICCFWLRWATSTISVPPTARSSH